MPGTINSGNNPRRPITCAANTLRPVKAAATENSFSPPRKTCDKSRLIKRGSKPLSLTGVWKSGRPTESRQRRSVRELALLDCLRAIGVNLPCICRMNSQRITRLIRLIEVLKNNGGHNATGLAKACSVSRRTIFRDIEVLRFAGLPVGYDEEHDCYSVMYCDDSQPIRVSQSEAFALAAMVLLSGLRDRLPIYESAASATHKLWSGLSATAKRRLHRLGRAIVVRPSQTNALNGKAKLFQQLVDARVSRRVVRIEYDTGHGNSTIKTNFRPYQLVYCQHNWYVVGRSSFHSEVRTFSLSRVSYLNLLSKRYRVPRDFNLDSYVGNAWAMHPGTGEDYAVAVRFSRAVAASVTDAYWHRTQQIESEESGAIIFRAHVSGLNEIASWILSFGDQAEVIEPAPLRQLVSQHVRKLAVLYAQQSGSADGVRELKQHDKSCKAGLAMQVQAL